MAIFVVYLALVAGLEWAGARKRRRGLGDYVLAGRTLTLPVFVATLVPSFYGGVLGIGEFTWTHGLSNWLVMALPYYVFAAVYALFLAGRIRLKPGLTIADHVESAYGVAFAVFAALLVFVLCSPADEFVMIGTLLSYFFGMALKPAMALGAVASLLFMLKGGLRSDVWANALQFLLVLIGFAVLFPFAASRVGGPAHLAALLPPGHLSLTGGLSIWQILGWWIIAAWTIVDPIFHQRAAAAGSPAVARRGILICIPFWMAIDAMTTVAGLYARAAVPRLSHPLMAYPKLADLVLPPGFRALFFCGMASSVLAGLQARILQSAISLGKDALGRAFKTTDAAKEKLTMFALVASTVMGYALAVWIPSVVGLWYALGSAVIPALLWPLISAYYPRLRPSRAFAFAASIGACAISFLWVGASHAIHHPLLGMNPMFPGLAYSMIIWGLGLWIAPQAQAKNLSAA